MKANAPGQIIAAAYCNIHSSSQGKASSPKGGFAEAQQRLLRASWESDNKAMLPLGQLLDNGWSVQRFFLILTGLFALFGVALGAIGAHALEERLPEELRQAFETGVRYHVFHALGLGLIALTLGRIGSERLLFWAGCLMCTGIVLFSGSIYAMALSGSRAFAYLTPVGGVVFLLAWGLFVFGVSRR